MDGPKDGPKDGPLDGPADGPIDTPMDEGHDLLHSETPVDPNAAVPETPTDAGETEPPTAENGIKLAKRYRGDLENVMRKKYGAHFAWGQLVSWFKQTIYDPSASLSADRRGTMSLPDPESAYSGCKPGHYQSRERRILLNHLLNNSSKAWPTTWRWSFRNPAKVYGSPFIDDAISTSRGEVGKGGHLVRGMMGE